MKATVKSGDGSVLHTLSLGNQVMGRVYAMTGERRNVYSVSESVLQQLDREPDFYRRSTAFDFQSYRVPSFTMELGNESATLVKHAFEDWRMTSPYELRANDRFITAMLDSLEIMRVREHIPSTAENRAAYGLEHPAARLSLTIEDRVRPQEILVGTASGDERHAYVMDPAEEWIYTVDASSLQRMPISALALRDNKILRFKGYQVHMFEVVTPDDRLRVRRDQKQRVVWKMEEPSTGDADAISIGRGVQRVGFPVFGVLRNGGPRSGPGILRAGQAGHGTNVADRGPGRCAGRTHFAPGGQIISRGRESGLRQATEQPRRVPGQGRVRSPDQRYGRPDTEIVTRGGMR